MPKAFSVTPVNICDPAWTAFIQLMQGKHSSFCQGLIEFFLFAVDLLQAKVNYRADPAHRTGQRPRVQETPGVRSGY
jgi:hypothetical protein